MDELPMAKAINEGLRAAMVENNKVMILSLIHI